MRQMAMGSILRNLFPHVGWNRLTVVVCCAHVILAALWVANERSSINPYDQFDDTPRTYQFWEWAKSHPSGLRDPWAPALSPSEKLAAKKQYLREVIAQNSTYRALSPEKRKVVDDSFLSNEEYGELVAYKIMNGKNMFDAFDVEQPINMNINWADWLFAEQKLKPRLNKIALVGVVPPISLALLIFSGLWVYRGFRTAR